MSEMNQQAIIRQIENILHHLDKYLPLANVHMVDYFIENVYTSFIPKEIRLEAETYGFQNTIKAIYHQQTEHLPHLNDYIKRCHDLTLKNTPSCLRLEHFKAKLQELGSKEVSSLKLDIFMKAKKSHETEVLGGIASALKEVSGTSHIIDIGDGKGYLSSLLALHYKIPVLGVDASATNTSGAVDRANKLSKVWNGVVTNIKTRETSIDLYKQITKFVDETINFEMLVSNVFLEEPKSIGLVGLHTCGNLAATCLKIFNESKAIKTICNVGCCYHFLTEEFETHNKNDCIRSQISFPMSAYLKNRKVVLKRGSRMIAAQSVDRILHNKERPNKAMFYRGLFEIIIAKTVQEKSDVNSQVGRFRKSSPNFHDYVTKASKRINLPLTMSADEINEIYMENQHKIDEMDFFYLVRCMLAPVIETVILLDRLLFLYENGHTNSYLVQLFDPVISPRCYGIVSIKN